MVQKSVFFVIGICKQKLEDKKIQVLSVLNLEGNSQARTIFDQRVHSFFQEFGSDIFVFDDADFAIFMKQIKELIS